MPVNLSYPDLGLVCWSSLWPEPVKLVLGLNLAGYWPPFSSCSQQGSTALPLRWRLLTFRLRSDLQTSTKVATIQAATRPSNFVEECQHSGCDQPSRVYEFLPFFIMAFLHFCCSALLCFCSHDPTSSDLSSDSVRRDDFWIFRDGQKTTDIALGTWPLFWYKSSGFVNLLIAS